MAAVVLNDVGKSFGRSEVIRVHHGGREAELPGSLDASTDENKKATLTDVTC
jgi:hypothetical protein